MGLWSKIKGWFGTTEKNSSTNTQNNGVEAENEQDYSPAQVQTRNRPPSAEKIQEGFNRMIDQLEGINQNLNKQSSQQQELLEKMNQTPELLEKQVNSINSLIEQLDNNSMSQKEVVEKISKMSEQSNQQSQELAKVNQHLEASAHSEAEMSERFTNFNESLDKLNENSASQTDSILQMSKTFATSDRYLKYLMSVQNRRFMWIFMTALSVCVLVILVLIGVIIYLNQ